MNANRIAAVMLRQGYLMRGSFSRVIPLFAWVAIDMILWGFLTRYLNTVASPGYNFVPVLLGAVLLWDFFTRVMQGVTMVFFEDVWSRNFLNVFASPIKISEYVSGLVLCSMATSTVGLGVMLALATTVFGLSFAAYGLQLFPFLMVLFLFGTAMGIFASGVVLRFGPAAEWFIWPLPACLTPFVGVFYPVSILPRWMQAVSRLLPPSYVFEGMRSIVVGGNASGRMLLWGVALSSLYILLAYRFFASIYRQAVRTGLIARYSAENVS